MNEEAPIKIPSLEKYGPLMKKEEVAEVLHLPGHIIAPLARAGLLEPYGAPRRYCVKLYSRDLLARRIVDQQWLDKVAAAIHRHWRNKNARKRAKQAGQAQTEGIRASESVTQ
ncbi:MAG: hypothetical protein ACLQSR_16155 [Limisphaerales bacterium]